MSISNNCTTHWMTTSSFRKGSSPSPEALTSTHINCLGMLPANSCLMQAVTFFQQSSSIFLPERINSCLKPSTPMRAMASVSWLMQFLMSLSTSSNKNDSDSKCSLNNLTRAVSACKHVGGPMLAAQEAAVPSERLVSAAPGCFCCSPGCIWQWMSSNNGLITVLKTNRHVSSSNELLPCFCKQSKRPFNAAALTSRLWSLTKVDKPRKMFNQCSAGCLTALGPPSRTSLEATEAAAFTARLSAACSKCSMDFLDISTLHLHCPNASRAPMPSVKLSMRTS
mmetsp:Transcript_15121/g.41588  ORF Transcript_15121/g.41588 Transcript_15121/m.41588 type:complete len:281 (-) Transcript_15121:2860-3702(-)